MFYFVLMPILLSMLFLFSCDNQITLSKHAPEYSASVHVQKISSTEKLPIGVRELILRGTAKEHVKFPLPYFLIPENHADYMRAHSFDVSIADQLTFLISGEKYHKMFILPDSEAHYQFLKHAYRFIGPDDTEFMASMTGPGNSFVVWNNNNFNKKAFIVNFDVEKERIQLIGLVLKFKSGNTAKNMQGQSIRTIASEPEKSQTDSTLDKK
jgi:hypothetical protein